MARRVRRARRLSELQQALPQKHRRRTRIRGRWIWRNPTTSARPRRRRVRVRTRRCSVGRAARAHVSPIGTDGSRRSPPKRTTPAPTARYECLRPPNTGGACRSAKGGRAEPCAETPVCLGKQGTARSFGASPSAARQTRRAGTTGVEHTAALGGDRKPRAAACLGDEGEPRRSADRGVAEPSLPLEAGNRRERSWFPSPRQSRSLPPASAVSRFTVEAVSA